MSERTLHSRAVELMVSLRSRRAEIKPEDYAWLESHLIECSECHLQNEAIEAAAAEMRSIPVMANRSMVRATQLRVRARARELQQQQESVRPLWLACAIAFGWAVVATPFLWQGFAWLGSGSRLPDVIWESGFFIVTLIPIAAVGAIGLATRHQHRAAS